MAALGTALLLATVFPVGSYVLSVLTSGMYGPVFKSTPPALFILTSYASNYLPVFLVAYWFIKHFHVVVRSPKKYRSTGLFSVGSALILVFATARVLAATVPGGGAGFAVASLAPLLVFPALAVLGVSVIRLAIGWGKGGA